MLVLLIFSRLKNCVKMKDTFKKAFSFALCYVFILCSTLNSASAAISNIPEMTDWQFAQALDAYAGLTDDQKDIANFLVGSQGYAFAGIAQSNLQSNFSSYSDTVNYVKDFGAKMWNEFDSHVDGVVESGRNNLRAVKNDLSNFFGNAVSYAKSRSESFSAWLGNVGIDYNSSSEFRIQFGKNQAQNNVDYFGDQGLYNWQYSSNVLSPSDFTFDWITSTMSGSANQSYYSYLNNMTSPHVKASYPSSGMYNCYFGTYTFSTYCNIFADLSNNTVYICDNNGNPFSSFDSYGHSVSNFTIQFLHYDGRFAQYSTTYANFRVIDLTLYSSLQSLFDAINNDPALLIYAMSTYSYKLCLSDFIQNLYVGYSWDNKQPWTVDYNLNLTSTSQYVTINAPTNVIYLDLNGFMRDLYDNPTIIYNYVVNNSIDGNGDPVDGDDFKPTSKFPGIPDSGITIGTEFFKINGLNPFFGPDGYIAVLWNNTKGLVTYLASVLSMLTFDGGNSPAFVIYGAIAVGVIGGIFSKFLL